MRPTSSARFFFAPFLAPFTAAFLVLLAALTLSAASQAAEEPSEAELAEIKEAIAAVQARIARDRQRRSSVEEELAASEQALAATARRISKLEGQVSQAEQRLKQLQQRQDRLEAQRAAQQEQVERYLRAAWQGGREAYLKLLLNQEGLDASARMLRYYRYFQEARAEKIDSFNHTLQEIATLRAEVQQQSLALAQDRRALLDERATLEQQRTQRQTLLAELEQRLAASGGELERLQAREQEVAALIEELRRSITQLELGGSDQPFASMKGKLPWPVEGPLRNSFGARHELGELTWQGLGILAEPGTQVQAVHHGRVVYADWFSQSGLLLIIDHGDGYMSLYAHNRELYREVGDWVNGGEVIAAVGNSGGQRETGLYFEIRHNGRSQDPVAWCRPRQ